MVPEERGTKWQGPLQTYLENGVVNKQLLPAIKEYEATLKFVVN